MMLVRGIRGATTVRSNSREEIIEATKELLGEIVRRNDLDTDYIASVVFTTTVDLNAEFPAVAAREMGWTYIALECMQVMNVPGSLPRCIRVLMHVNTERAATDIKHVYLHEAKALRRDLVDASEA